ncbi:hypothetical protein PRUPE_7G013400 [Prunus persica]|uniref:Uncharacterized protein n=1 Tax=Prunus persica TaxID=3760 RepID=A0A251N4X0_PRUPE|nr:hypothetical protein PRUPE_7G013400 [Prunus persica]
MNHQYVLYLNVLLELKEPNYHLESGKSAGFLLKCAPLLLVFNQRKECLHLLMSFQPSSNPLSFQPPLKIKPISLHKSRSKKKDASASMF